MPLFTPSRGAVIVLALLVTFLWTFGLPQHLSAPSIPIVHDRPEASLPEPLTPQSPNGNKPPSQAEQAKKPTRPDLGTPAKLKLEADVTPSEESEPDATPAPPPAPSRPDFCKEIRAAPDVMIIVKTSVAEIHDSLPAHLKTLLTCAPNAAIFSDHVGDIDGFKTHDALDTISNTTRTTYDEFREYEKIKSDNGHKPSMDSSKGLDKWKLLPMVYKTFKQYPNFRFYVVIEVNTSLNWPNLLQWLGRLDYRIPYYSGAPMNKGDTRYAQQAPGILLSYGALRLYSKTYDERYTSDWEARVGKECCGDVVLAQSMADSQVEFVSSFPLLQGERPSTLDWTDRHWCAPIVSWHHMTTTEEEKLRDTQQAWTKKHGWDKPFLTRHAFEEFILPHLADKKEDWDNISSDTHILAEPGRKEKLDKQKGEEDKKKQEQEQKKGEEERKKKEQEQQKKEETAGEKTKDPSSAKPASPSVPDPKAPKKPMPESPAPANASPKPPAHLTVREAIDWDKIGSTIKDAADSVEACQSVCQKTEDCLQWKYSPKGDGECHLGKVLRLGRQRTKDDGDEKWTSGWVVDRVKTITKGWGECDQPNWRFNQ